MHKSLKSAVVFVFIFCLFLSGSAQSQSDSLTITTYYPSPYGDYNQLTTHNNTNLATDGGRVGIGTSGPGAKLQVANTSVSSWTWSALSGAVSLELGQNTAGNVGSIKLNSYSPGQFVFIRPSNGNYHIDSTTGQYYFNWDESVRGASNGAIHMANEAGTHTVEIQTAGNSWFTGGNVGIGYTNPGSAKLAVNGYVGIGTTGPTAPLHITNSPSGWQTHFHNAYGGPARAYAYFSHGGGYGAHIRSYTTSDSIYILELYNASASSAVFYASGRTILGLAGNVGIGWSPSYKLDVNGTIRCYGWVICSSKDCKKEIRAFSPSDYKDALNTAKNLNLYHFRYKDKDKDTLSHIGLLAEDAPQELLSSSGKEIDIPDTIGFLLAAVKAQQGQMEVQQEKIELLEQRIETLEQ